jgi:hypothetical protein
MFIFSVDDFDMLMLKIKKIFLKNTLHHNSKHTLGIGPFSRFERDPNAL